jgi:hypothetical protein
MGDVGSLGFLRIIDYRQVFGAKKINPSVGHKRSCEKRFRSVENLFRHSTEPEIEHRLLFEAIIGKICYNLVHQRSLFAAAQTRYGRAKLKKISLVDFS